MSVDTASAPSAPPDEAVTRVGKRNWKTPITLGVLGLFALIVFGFLAPPGEESTFRITRATDFVQIEPISVSSQVAGIALGVLCLVLAAYSFVRIRAWQPVPLWVPLTFGLAFVFAFLTWTVAGTSIPLTNLLQGAIALAVPLVFGAMCGLLGERSGVINIAIEGQLLAGAFLSGVVASLAGSPWFGLIAAPIAGMLVAWLLAVFTVKYFVNQIIVGVVLNVLVIGVTNFLYSQVLVPNREQWNAPGRFSDIPIPGLSKIPIIGPVLFNQNIIVYVMYATVAVLTIALFRSRWGLRTRAVGEHPQAADTAGIRVNSVRFRNVVLAGALSGFGGAFYTIGSTGAFGREMTAGQGFIALAVMILGRWHPIGALFAALLFGFVLNLQSVLGLAGAAPFSSQLMLMAPYLVTIIAVAGFAGRVRAPAAEGIPYIKS
ncbi:MAG TPA: ABC transporter permease [Jiangellaceae bacterium]